MEFTPGNTPVVSLREHHRDVVKLDLGALGELARLVADAHRSGASLTLTRKQVIETAASAVRQRLVEVESLKGAMRSSVEQALLSG